MAEAMAIVVSILLAFWIDTWWSERIERNALAENMVALEQEISHNIDEMEEALRKIENVFEKINDVFVYIAEQDQQSLPDKFYEDVGAVYMIWEPALVHSALDVVVSPDNLRLIVNPELRILIVTTKESVLHVDMIVDFLWKDYADHQGPFLKRHFVISDFKWNEDQVLLQQSGLLYPVPESTLSADVAAIETREFWNLLYHWRATYLDAARTILEAKEHHQDALRILESEIELIQ
jgi:hypothetical protein